MDHIAFDIEKEGCQNRRTPFQQSAVMLKTYFLKMTITNKKTYCKLRRSNCAFSATTMVLTDINTAPNAGEIISFG